MFINKKLYTKSKEVLRRIVSIYGNDLLDEDEANLIIDLLPILNSLYKDRYEIEILRDYVYIVIHFPSVTITNENDKSTTVTNLFLRIQFNLSMNFFKMDVLLLNPTFQQYIKGYAHSHAPRVEFNQVEWSKLCLGSDEDTLNLLRINSYSSIEKWESFFMFLHVFIQAESLQGVPHNRIENLVLNNRLELHQNNYSNYLSSYSSLEVMLPKVNWCLDGDNNIQVVDDELLEQHCLIHGNDRGRYNSNNIAYKDGVGNYYQPNSNIEFESINNIKWSYTFLGQIFNFKILNIEELNTSTIYVVPQIKSHVTKNLVRRIKQNLVTKAITNGIA